jgi:16S rRNA (guanine966-N2)-methyltransferase
VSRIIAGLGKGRNLKAPAGPDTRPTGARVRQTLFDILAPRVVGCRFLDLCAGGGGVGLEALSRGAERVVLVDSARSAAEAIRQNVRLLRAPSGRVFVHQQDARVALRGLSAVGTLFDLVYLDPPYASDLYEELLAALPPLLAPGGVVIAEHFHKRALPETIGPLARSRRVRVGDHLLSFYAAPRPGGTSEP